MLPCISSIPRSLKGQSSAWRQCCFLLVCLCQVKHEAEERCLSCSVVAQQTYYLPFLHIEVGDVDGSLVAVFLFQIADVYFHFTFGMSFLVSCLPCRLSVRIIRRIILTFSGTCFHIAKIMQASGKKACFQFPECSLSYAKIMQASGNRACSWFSECSLSYAKITYFTLTSVQTVLFFVVRNAWRNACQTQSVRCIQHVNEYLCTFSDNVFYRIKARNRSACGCFIWLCIRVWSLGGRRISVQTASSGA